uniref:LysR family transcriptional regulator n=1 Tax=uncultured bacterium BLR8 TaxID=506524 RepID=C0IN83_9BACT|nr:LysR family transcriptional regulator [uncultured bacterium BLR8]
MIDKSDRSGSLKGPALKASLEQWTLLAAVVDHGGFAQAAKALHRSQSAVSYGVARLQEALGLPVLQIEGRRAVLTPHGVTLLRRARLLLTSAAALESLAASLERGWEPQLRLVVDAAFPRARLLAIVAELQQSCPQTQMQLSDAVLSGAEDAIVEGSGDVVITTRVPQGHLGEWLLDVTFVAVAAPGHPLLALGGDIGEAQLAAHTQAVVRDSGRQPRDEGWLGAERRCTVGSVEASLALVRAGLAYAWLPEDLVRESLNRGELALLPLGVGASRKLSLYLVLVRADSPGPAARAAVESFRRHLPRTRADFR